MPLLTPAEPLPDVYRERAHLIAHLAALHPSVMVHDADPDAPGWPVVYVTLPTGQVSWHISPDDMDLFGHVPTGSAEWDDHDTAEKYRRLDAHTAALTTPRPEVPGDPACPDKAAHGSPFRYCPCGWIEAG